MSYAQDEGIFIKNGTERQVHCYLSHGKYSGTLCSLHYHKYMEILYSIEGTLKVWVNGEFFNLSPGDLFIINAGVPHTVHSTSKYSYIVIKFFPAILSCESCALTETKYFLPLYRKDFESKRLLKKDDISDGNIKAIVNKIYDEWIKEDFGYELAVRGGIIQLFTEIIRIWKPSDTDNLFLYSDEKARIIMDAAEYCKENYADVTAEETAARCGMSYSYFSRTFKKVMNTNFTQYINDLKITAAIHMLLTTDSNSTYIAMETGFSSTSYFVYSFKKKTGFTPTEYKQRFKSEFLMENK